jgi:hypothetical protein
VQFNVGLIPFYLGENLPAYETVWTVVQFDDWGPATARSQSRCTSSMPTREDQPFLYSVIGNAVAFNSQKTMCGDFWD